MASQVDNPGYYWWFFSVCGFSVLGVTWLSSSSIPAWLGPLATAAIYLGQNFNTPVAVIFMLLLIVHLFEALYAIVLAKKLRMNNLDVSRWGIQTFLLGYPSLRLLLRRMKNRKQRRR